MLSRNRLLLLVVFTAFFGCSEDMEEVASGSGDVWEKAKNRGVSFRAVGQEPGWLLEISEGDSVVLVSQYGEKRQVFRYVEPVVDKGLKQTLYRTKNQNQSLEIRIISEQCIDVMSGEEFPARVVILLEGQKLDGCGKSLR